MSYKVSEQELVDAPKIKLGPREFAIPPLAPSQQRIIVTTILAIMPTMVQLFAAVDSGEPAALMNSIDSDVYDKILDVIYTGVTRGYPELTRDEFLDIPMTINDMFVALTVIMGQVRIPQKEHA